VGHPGICHSHNGSCGLPPHFWIERESEYIIAGTERARQQALTIGLPADHIFQTSGMILKPKFYEKTTVDRVAERKRLGLEADCPTGIVLFGGYGSQVMVDIARQLNESGGGVQLILICGHNEKLAAELKNLPARKPNLVVGLLRTSSTTWRWPTSLLGSQARARSAKRCSFTCLSSWNAIPEPCRKSDTTRNG